MAKLFQSGKWKKRLAFGTSLVMATTLALGVFAACKTTDDTDTSDEEENAAMPADSQLLKNGNFEFYSEMTKEEKELKNVLNTPSSWSFSSGSPSSDTRSGLIDLKYWESITGSKHEFTDITDAYTNWDEGSIYDKLLFFYKCDNPANNSAYNPFEDAYDALASSSAEKTFFTEKAFSSVDYEDVQYLKEELGEGESKTVPLHGDTDTDKQEERGILMIHNRRTSDGAVGTAQSYSSSTTVTLKAGTSAKISVWVKTANLRHYYADAKEEGDALDGLKVTSEAGAYIGVTQTVGGTTLDQMQIKNINTEVTNPDKAYNGWEQYTVYVRASTFATTTVRLVLGLGQGNSDDRYEAVNGYALFDDATIEVIDNGDYVSALDELSLDQNKYGCTVSDKKTAKFFDATYLAKEADNKNTYAIDLYAGDEQLTPLNLASTNLTFGLTEEKSGNSVYTSERIDSSLGNNITDPDTAADRKSITAVKSFEDIAGETTNGYLQNIAKNDFKSDSYPFAKDAKNIILLLSTNGAAYTAKLSDATFSLAKGEQMLLSFFVKTSAVISGRTGGTVTLVEGENKTTISAFDSTTVDTVDINDEKKDIYDGWVQCFFFVQNDTEDEDPKTFSIEFSLGPTSIASSDKYDYGQGYAAFANLETRTLTKTEYSYASTGDRAKKVSLTEFVEDTTVFDSATASSNIEEGLGTPLNFKGVLAGSDWMVPSTEESPAPENKVPAGVLAGLLNYKNVANYKDVLGTLTSDTTLNDDSWKAIFGDSGNSAKTALQPLVIINTTNEEKPAYGYFATEATISANTYQKISLRVKLSAGATATVYLTDTSEFSNKGYTDFLAPNAPKVTYWYDENGNIMKSDPTEKGFNKNTGTAFELQTNGLYLKADSDDTSYYANLRNYKEKDGNLVLGDDTTIAFYGHNNNYYAYRTENSDGTYSFDDNYIVKDLYENGGKEIARYDYTAKKLPASVIEVTNPSTTEATDWVTVTFYVHTGSEEKNYRLEVWAGDRTGEKKIPANGYVFFDRYSSSSISNYDTLLSDAVADLEDDEGVILDENGNLPEKYAYYYTFTFYDSVNYLRYDVNEDTDEVGNLYASYDQSAYSEELISLVYNDENGDRTGAPSYIRFLNYAASDVTVTPDTPADDDTDEEETESTPISTGDILLIVSSSLLGVVIIFVIVMLIIRHFSQKRRRAARISPAQDKRYKPSAKKAASADDTEEEENPFVKNRKAKEAAEQAKAEEAEKEPDAAPAPAEEPATETVEEPAEEPAEETPAEESSDSDKTDE